MYHQVDPGLRRSMNRAWFHHLIVTEDEDGVRVTDDEREPFGAVMHSALHSGMPMSGEPRIRTNAAGSIPPALRVPVFRTMNFWWS